MVDHKVGSVLINDEGKHIGLFSETDVVRKVIARGIDPTKIPVSLVMSEAKRDGSKSPIFL